MSSSIVVLCVAFLALSSQTAGQRRNNAKILTEAGHYEGEIDGSVTLPCSVSDIGRRSVFWFKGKTPSDRELIMQMKSIRGKVVVPRQFQRVLRTGKLTTNGTGLVVNQLTMEDADSYTCSMAWARQTVTHTLEVLEVAEPQEMVVTYEPSSMQAEVTEGGSFTLTCNATGEPLPTVTWYKEDRYLQEGWSLTLNDVQKDGAGSYVCRSSNGVVPDQEGVFNVRVPYLEVWPIGTRVIAQSDVRQAQLACWVKGDPPPKVVWYNQEGPVPDDEAHRYFSQDNISYLQLERLTPSDLGRYECYVDNQWSRDLATVELDAAPGPVRVIQSGPSIQGPLVYNFTWEVESLAPVTFYYFTYKEQNGSEEEKVSVKVEGSNDNPHSDTVHLKTFFLNVKPATTYEVLVSAISEGYQPGPEMTRPIIVTTPEWDVVDDEELWKVLKRTLAVISRLPQLVKALQ